MDIPGLNEKDDFYLKKIIPFLVNKCIFSIYIFDIEHYENEDTFKIYQNYSNQLNKIYNKYSIYILNKIDYISEEDKKNFKDEKYHFEKFKNFLKDDFKVDLENNFFLKLNSKELFNKINAFSELKTYILHLIDTIKIEEIDDTFSFIEYIKIKFVEYFQITKEEINNIFNENNEIKYNVYFDENEYNEIMDSITNKGINPDFEENEFNKIKYIFKNKFKVFLPIPELNSINDIILESINKSLEEFFDWEKVLDLMKNFKESINKIFENESERKKYIEICVNILDSFKKELENKSKLKNIEWNINVIEPLKKIFNSLLKLEPNDLTLKNLKEDFDSLTYFIYNYRKIRICLLGGYSTGKSSFLNNIIGKDILPVDINRCTNRGIILRHNKNKDSLPQLFKTSFTHVTNPDYWYFKDDENLFALDMKILIKNYLN